MLVGGAFINDSNILMHIKDSAGKHRLAYVYRDNAGHEHTSPDIYVNSPATDILDIGTGFESDIVVSSDFYYALSGECIRQFMEMPMLDAVNIAGNIGNSTADSSSIDLKKATFCPGFELFFLSSDVKKLSASDGSEVQITDVYKFIRVDYMLSGSNVSAISSVGFLTLDGPELLSTEILKFNGTADHDV